ncbi:hypothetical protein L596_014054 [Steinernema carpocapsae]|uniref:Uncharacterized protein n=1 Tax=Steinernema carpocapsae TaxID=34508 RepID=A0A4U5NBL6_STECR|nr:hypothetical protein L596_014054 [Steinernema carpocapsae]
MKNGLLVVRFVSSSWFLAFWRSRRSTLSQACLCSSRWRAPSFYASVPLLDVGVGHLPGESERPFSSGCGFGDVLELRDASEPGVAAFVDQPDSRHPSFHPALGDGELLPCFLRCGPGFASVQHRREDALVEELSLPSHLYARRRQERSVFPENVPSAALVPFMCVNQTRPVRCSSTHEMIHPAWSMLRSTNRPLLSRFSWSCSVVPIPAGSKRRRPFPMKNSSTF